MEVAESVVAVKVEGVMEAEPEVAKKAAEARNLSARERYRLR